MADKTPSEIYRAWKEQFEICQQEKHCRVIDRALVMCQHPEQNRLEYCTADRCIMVNGDEQCH